MTKQFSRDLLVADEKFTRVTYLTSAPFVTHYRAAYSHLHEGQEERI